MLTNRNSYAFYSFDRKEKMARKSAGQFDLSMPHVLQRQLASSTTLSRLPPLHSMLHRRHRRIYARAARHRAQ